MKDFFVYRTAGRATLPFVILICALLAGPGTARAAKKASVTIGFVGVPPKSMSGGIPTPNFQNVLLNVQSVRINPKADAAPGNGKWQNIPAPPGIASAGTNAELQIDLNASQNIPQLFNTAPVRVDTYRVAELILDTQNPGTLIPNCPTSSPIGNSDGCISYPIEIANGNVLTVSVPDGLVSVAKGSTAALILQVTMSNVVAPTTPGGAYTVNISLSPLSTSVLGVVSGSVHVNPGSGSGSSTKTKLTVTAEAIGTNTSIATTQIQTSSACPTSDPCFTLMLPAAGGPLTETNLGFGTLYDLAIGGGGNTYNAARLPPLYPGASTAETVDFTGSNSVTGSQMLGNLTGMIYDGCVALKPIVGATLELLVPPISISTPPPMFCLSNPDQCVVVASANTDNTGFFPLPGTITTPAQFNSVPKLGKNKPFVLQVSAPGYQTTQFLAAAGAGTTKNNGGTCSTDGGTTWIPCDLSLPTAYITGGFPIVPPNNGQSTLVQVFAEDHDSNNIQSALPMPVNVTSSTSGLVPYTINVPPLTSSVTAYDLYAATIDLYQGVVDPYQGHNIVAVSNVPAPAACATTTAPTISDPTQVIGCVGHGSITGTATNADLGTSVVLEKLDPEGPSDDNEVQITNSIVQNQFPNESPSSNYAFCAPADTYQLQKFEAAQPVPSLTPTVPTATPSPVGDSVSVTISTPPPINGPTPTASATPTTTGSPLPTPTATPTQKVTCPTTCTKPDGSCPGICNNVSVEPL